MSHEAENALRKMLQETSRKLEEVSDQADMLAAALARQGGEITYLRKILAAAKKIKKAHAHNRNHYLDVLELCGLLEGEDGE